MSLAELDLFFSFLVSACATVEKAFALFSLQMKWLKLKVPQHIFCILNPTFFPFSPPAIKKEAKQPEEGRYFVLVSWAAHASVTHSYRAWSYFGTPESEYSSSSWLMSSTETTRVIAVSQSCLSAVGTLIFLPLAAISICKANRKGFPSSAFINQKKDNLRRLWCTYTCCWYKSIIVLSWQIPYDIIC